ncbi:MAG: hypothetical protein ACD_20C00120G0001 [uncultured bacterium]|nr:MAG: hypothetical protein ACD_20C00120G0001 [uncultured bacterium]
MRFWDSVKLIGFNQSPLVPLTGQSNDNERQKKNQNIFDNLLEQVPQDRFEKTYKRLNDNDSDIINKNLVQYLPNDSLRIELQLQGAENVLKEVDKEIKSVKLLELDQDGDKLAKLAEKKEQVNQEIHGYKAQYRSLGLIYKITDIVADGYNKIKDDFLKVKDAFTSRPLIETVKKFIPGMKEREELKEILDKLDALQLNTEKVFAAKPNPYGENDKYFREITILMSKANKLDAQTNKFIDTTQKAKSKIIESSQDTYNKAVSFGKSSYIKAVEFVKEIKDKINFS